VTLAVPYLWLRYFAGLTGQILVSLSKGITWVARSSSGRRLIGMGQRTTEGPGSGVVESRVATPQRVLVVDDDPTISDVVRRYLERAGYEVTHAADGLAALDRFADQRPDLVVLDLMLPGVDGLEVCRRLRSGGSDVPVIMLTALGEEADRVLGLQLGADDYVSKPFSPRELVLRVQSVLRRAAGPVAPDAGSQVLVDGDLVVDTGRRVARLAGAELALTVREFDLLAYLVRHPARAFRRAQLLAAVWGWEFGDQSTVTVHVRRLREKVEADPAQPRRIVTVWGVGYRYEPGSAGA
jgi:DNA-binding response OmpR family regulator